ncbi:MAG: mannose-1-phosphate guanylyltransferase [Planctomyces sp.]|nr:mannose-1-phosphate guanylyltransferase [Planctomyces sp.]
MLHAVIMAGGSGTRFWPQSRHQVPKQLLRLAGERTMIQQTVDRGISWASGVRTWIVTNAAQAGRTSEQLPEVPKANILVEPAARNTAPCVGLAAVRLLVDDPDAIMFVMPADHVIQPVEAFTQAVEKACQLVEQSPERLVLFGVTPTFPSTGYGYIERGEMIGAGTPPVFSVASFREKPKVEVAEEYLRTGRYYWNCGIFCWKASTIMKLIQEHEPEIHGLLMKIADAYRRGDSEAVIAAEFPRMRSISIDYAVLERAAGVTVMEAPFQWDDVGSWLAVPRLNGVDTEGNTVDGPYCGVSTKNCIIRSSGNHLIATLGVSDLIIVHTPDATLVAHSSESERIKELLVKLQADGRTDYL